MFQAAALNSLCIHNFPHLPIMNTANIRESHDDFRVLQTTEHTQTASMRLKPGEATSDEPSTHEHSEQTVLVLEGEVVAEIDKEQQTLRAGQIVIVPPKTRHRFVNHGKTEVFAFTTYAPPAYPANS